MLLLCRNVEWQDMSAYGTALSEVRTFYPACRLIDAVTHTVCFSFFKRRLYSTLRQWLWVYCSKKWGL